jgi:hypothetical protein
LRPTNLGQMGKRRLYAVADIVHKAAGSTFLARAAFAVTLLVVASSPALVIAIPFTPFRYEAQAQRHCPGDNVVWLDFRKGVYYSKGQRYYARGFNGSFVCRNEARGSGYRRSLLGLR